MSLRTPNSSFIFDRLRRSIRLCAVFRAIFRPATLVDDGCFFLVGVVFAAIWKSSLKDSVTCSGCPRGFIWMIFRDLVGGGGKANASLVAVCAAEDRLRILTVSLAGIAGDFGGVGW